MNQLPEPWFLAIAAGVAGVAGVAGFLAAVVLLVPAPPPPAGVNSIGAFLHFSQLSGLFGIPGAWAVAACIGVPLFYRAQKDGRSGPAPFLLIGMPAGAVIVFLLWFLLFQAFEPALFAVGLVSGGMAAAAFWICVRSRLRDTVPLEGQETTRMNE